MQNLPRKQQEVALFLSYIYRTRGRVDVDLNPGL